MKKLILAKHGMTNTGNTKLMHKRILQNWQLYVFLVPCIAYFIVFKYLPMWGVQIAFKDYMPMKGIFSSPFVGFVHFQRFFNSSEFWMLIKNTLSLSILNLLIGFPIPIILALMLNQTRNVRFKKIIQTTIYAPHFISVVIIVSLLHIFLSPTTGLVNTIITFFGGDPVFFMAESKYFRSIYVISEIWQTAGYSTIVYIAALTGVSPELHESAVVDGANTMQRIIHIDVPCILPTAMVLLILNTGRVLSVGFEKVLLMQNDMTRSVSEIISTYVYKVGFGGIGGIPNFSYASAIGLFESIVSLIILFSVNKIAKKVSNSGLF